MNKIDWSKAPDGADFYAFGCFRANLGDSNPHFWINDDGWHFGSFTLEGCASAGDFEVNPNLVADEPATSQKTQWTSKHYDNFYELTAEEIKAGKIKVDPYFVSMVWRLGEKDNTGVLFHQLKTISRFGDKHDVEREVNALYNQVLSLAALLRVNLK